MRLGRSCTFEVTARVSLLRAPDDEVGILTTAIGRRTGQCSKRDADRCAENAPDMPSRLSKSCVLQLVTENGNGKGWILTGQVSRIHPFTHAGMRVEAGLAG